VRYSLERTEKEESDGHHRCRGYTDAEEVFEFTEGVGLEARDHSFAEIDKLNDEACSDSRDVRQKDQRGRCSGEPVYFRVYLWEGLGEVSVSYARMQSDLPRRRSIRSHKIDRSGM
jgi:hypothetical protein